MITLEDDNSKLFFVERKSGLFNVLSKIPTAKAHMERLLLGIGLN